MRSGEAARSVTTREGEQGLPSWRQDTVRFAAIMAVFGAVVLPSYTGETLAGPLEPLTSATAHATHALIRWTGLPAQLDAAVIYVPGGFSYLIHFRCTGILPVAILVVSILAVPGPARSKLLGIVAGVPVLLGFNFVRLVHLFHVGTARPEYFHLAHAWAWRTATIAMIVGLWLGWMMVERSRLGVDVSIARRRLSGV